MPIIHHSQMKKNHRIYIRGAKKGSGIVDTVLMKMIKSGLPFEKMLASLGAAAWGALGTYGVKKGIDYITKPKQVISAMNEPPLTVSPGPQGTLKNDILPVKNDITIVNPENHMIDLPDGMKKMTVGTVYDSKQGKYISGSGMKKKKRGGQMPCITNQNGVRICPSPGPPRMGIDGILNNKSKEILSNLRMGSGIMKL